MYPRVKVRGGAAAEEEEREHPVTPQEEKSSLLLKLFEPISLQNRCSPGNEYCNISPSVRIPRIPKSYVPNLPMPSVAISKDIKDRSTGKKNKETDEESRIKATPVPRPRAVLSSPDNDGMIGSRNRLSRERDPISRKHISGGNTLVQGNRVLKNDSVDGPVSTRKVSKGADDMIHPKETLAKKLTASGQKSSVRKGKASTGRL